VPGKLVVASVRVTSLRETDDLPEVSNVRHRPLKATGHFGGKIRSHIELDLAEIGAPHPAPLIFENSLPAAELRKVAIEVALSWISAPAASDELVRRYDREPPMVRDVKTGWSSGRPDALSARTFESLLAMRIDGVTHG
jgi:hypothetical protein